MPRKKKNIFEQKVKEGNWTVVFNEVLEGAYKSNLTQNELKVFLFIWRKTWGWKDDSAIIRVKDIVKELGLDKKRASIALSGLKKKYFVGELTTNRYQIQMDISKWRTKKFKTTKKRDSFVGKLTTNRDHFVGETPTSVGELTTRKSQDSSKNADQQTPKDTVLKKRSKENIIRDKDDDSLLLLKPKTLKTLTGKTFRLGKKEVLRLLAMTDRKNVDSYFCAWMDYILSDPKVNTPGPYFKKVIEEGSEPLPTLEFASRVKSFNSFTGKEERAENSIAFENMVEKVVLEKATKEIIMINHYYSRESEKELRQKKKTNLIHHVCSLIKPSRLKRFRKKLLKVDPGNRNFRQVIKNGYELHTKKVYSNEEDMQIL